MIFDLDGTLYERTFLHKPLVFLHQFPGIRHVAVFGKARKEMEGQVFSTEREFLENFSSRLAKYARSDSVKSYLWYRNVFYPALIKAIKGYERPDVSKVLSTLKNRGYKLAVLSDHTFISERLNVLNINPSVFDLLDSTESIGALKPDPRAFMKTASGLGISPAKVLVVGDTYKDRDGALNAGMKSVWIVDKDKDEDLSDMKITWNDFKKVVLNPELV